MFKALFSRTFYYAIAKRRPVGSHPESYRCNPVTVSIYDLRISLFGKGIDCEVVKLDTNGWQKGKLRAKVILEFCPDSPPVEEKPIDNQLEPPFENLRRLMGEENI